MKISKTIYGPYSRTVHWASKNPSKELLHQIGERNKEFWDIKEYLDSLHKKGQEFITKKLGL